MTSSSKPFCADHNEPIIRIIYKKTNDEGNEVFGFSEQISPEILEEIIQERQ